MNSTATSLPSAQKKIYLLVLCLAVLVNLAGIGIKYFTDDPSLYSVLARNIAQSNDFFNLTYHGKDWLDKPHFPFWVAAISFKIFGINTIAYKMPALLFFFASVGYTYKLAKKLYGFETALIAILILLTAQHVVMSNTDVRAEPYIMGLLMGAVYHFYRVKERFSWGHIILASLFTACAVMTKGIYLLIPIGGAIMGDYLFKKNIRGLLSWKWLLAFILVVIFTLPEIYALHIQFDLHPEKVVFGQTGISGIHWFLWDSQFGRFYNNGFIRNSHGDFFFFLHTLLWAFAPWSFLLYYVLFKAIKNIVKGKDQPEYATISGSVIMLFIFSVSKFQLPFYTNILFPFFAILTAVFVRDIIDSDKNRFFTITQSIIAGLLIIFILALNFVFSIQHWPVFLLLTAVLIIVARYIYKKCIKRIEALFLLNCCVAIWVNAYLIAVVYPTLGDFKGDVHAAEYVNQYYPHAKVVAAFNVPNAFEFYCNQPVLFAGLNEARKQANTLVLINDEQKAELEKATRPFKLLKSFDNYPHENMMLPFIIEWKRPTSLNHFYLVKLSSEIK